VKLNHDDGGALIRDAFKRMLPFGLISYLLEKGCTFPPETDRDSLIEMIESQLPRDSIDYDFERLECLKLLFASGRIDPKERMFPRGRGIQHLLRFNRSFNTPWSAKSKLFEYLVESVGLDFAAVDEDGESPFSLALTAFDTDLLDLLYRYKPLVDGRSRFLPPNLLDWRNKTSEWAPKGCSLIAPALAGGRKDEVESFKCFCNAVGIDNVREMAKLEWMVPGAHETQLKINLLEYLLQRRCLEPVLPLLRYCVEELHIVGSDPAELQRALLRKMTDDIRTYLNERLQAVATDLP
jgi:hypothetical protein